MGKVIKAYQFGSPAVFVAEEEILGRPGRSEVKLTQYAVGVNYADTLVRRGLMAGGKLPFVDGFEAAGVITEVGEDVEGWKVGDRVAYYMQLGAYAQERIVPADSLVALPDGLSFEKAAALLIKGLTAEMLLFDSYRVKKGDYVLIQGATGGVASLVTMWAKALGVKVIAVVGAQTKKEIALKNGAFAAIVSSTEPIAEKVMELTSGKGVDAVYDGVGQATFHSSAESLKLGGTFAQYGFASGPAPDGLIQAESRRRNLSIQFAQIGDYVDKVGLQKAAEVLFEACSQGVFNAQDIQTYPLTDAARAHEDMENRNTQGALVLLP